MFSPPLLGNLRKKDPEVLHVVGPVDECECATIKEFDGKKLTAKIKEGLDLGEEDEKEKLEEPKSEFEPLTKFMKGVFGDKVEKAIASGRMVDSLCVLTSSEYSWSAVDPTHSIMTEM